MSHYRNHRFNPGISPIVAVGSRELGYVNQMKKVSRKAFTLIELLVVISIIAVLAAMLIPAISLVRDMAVRTTCSSNMRQVYMALDSYRSDLEGVYPQVYWDDPSFNTWSRWEYMTTTGRWQHALEEYTRSFKVFNCPKVAKIYPNIAVFDVDTGGVPRGAAPANGSGSWGTCGMAYNSQCFGRPEVWSWSGWTVGGPMSTDKVKQYITQFIPTGTIARCPVFTDGSWQNDGTNQEENRNGTFWPHRTVSNMVFSDGHMESRLKSQVLYSNPLQIAE